MATLHTGMLAQILEALIWRHRPKSLDDIPFDVVFALSFYLSVKDLCTLRATSRQLKYLVQNRLLWLLVLRDILEVRPIPRLSYALDDMTLEELMKTTIRLNALDRKIRGLDPNIKLTQVATFDSDLTPTLVPGGRYFVTIEEPNLELILHDVEANDLSKGQPFLPRFEHRILFWNMVPVSATVVNVVVATLDSRSYALDHNGMRLPRSYVHVYRCDIVANSWEQIDYFYVNARFLGLSFDTQFLTMMWRNIGSGHSMQANIRAYVRRESTAVLNLVDVDLHCTMASIIVIDQCHFVVASDNVARLFCLPTFYPIVGTYLGGTTVDHLTIWRSNNRATLASFQAPFIVDLQPLRGECPSSSPPTKWFLWSGGDRHIMTRAAGPFEYNIERRQHLPGDSYRTVLDCSVGKFSVMHGTSDDKLLIFPLPINYDPSSRGFTRLDATPASDDILLTEVPFSRREKEVMTALSYDEESGYVYMCIEDEGSISPRIVVAILD